MPSASKKSKAKGKKKKPKASASNKPKGKEIEEVATKAWFHQGRILTTREERDHVVDHFSHQLCHTKLVRVVCREAYERGLVLSRCSGCGDVIVLADRPGFLGDIVMTQNPMPLQEFFESMKQDSVYTFCATFECRNDNRSKVGKAVSEQDYESDGIVKSDPELEAIFAEPDNDLIQKMGDLSVEVTEESHDAFHAAKEQAMVAISEGKLEEAIDHLTEAILLNPASAITYVARAGVFIKMKKPNAAIRDANAALDINPDLAKGYKTRGMALAILGQWEEAAKVLRLASKLDHNEDIGAVLKMVERNANKIEERREKYDHLRKEKEDRKNVRERRCQQAEYQAAHELLSSCRKARILLGDIDWANVYNDPVLMEAFKDPHTMIAMGNSCKSLANMVKYMTHPKVGPVMERVCKHLGLGPK